MASVMTLDDDSSAPKFTIFATATDHAKIRNFNTAVPYFL